MSKTEVYKCRGCGTGLDDLNVWSCVKGHYYYRVCVECGSREGTRCITCAIDSIIIEKPN